MKIEDYEQYWQKGGTYVLPIEIFNELFYEIENWKKESEQLQKKYESEKSKNQRAIKIIEDNYYSKNTTDIDSIVVSNNKLIQVRKILKGENNE